MDELKVRRGVHRHRGLESHEQVTVDHHLVRVKGRREQGCRRLLDTLLAAHVGGVRAGVGEPLVAGGTLKEETWLGPFGGFAALTGWLV